MSSPHAMTQRALHVVAVMAIAVAVTGYFVGIRPAPPAPAARWEAPPIDAAGLAPAPTYGELGSGDRGAMGARQRAAFAAMLADRPALDAERHAPDEATRLATRQARAARRAYDGAPPRIPHAIEQMEVGDCATCHTDGVRIGTRVAPAMSHATYASCTQCHVVENAPMPGAVGALDSGPPIDTRFVGLPAPEAGPRAWEGAPPQIPHPTWMRERCASCHGVLATGLATSHPWRQSCTQCHAPSADFDQAPRSALPPLGGAP